MRVSGRRARASAQWAHTQTSLSAMPSSGTAYAQQYHYVTLEAASGLLWPDASLRRLRTWGLEGIILSSMMGTTLGLSGIGFGLLSWITLAIWKRLKEWGWIALIEHDSACTAYV